jgi:hypothetical protein
MQNRKRNVGGRIGRKKSTLLLFLFVRLDVANECLLMLSLFLYKCIFNVN